MTHKWHTKQKIATKKISFQDEGHAREGPMAYYYRKLRAIRVSFPEWVEADIVAEILEGAPQEWQNHFRIRPDTLLDLCNNIQAYKHLFKKEADLRSNVDKLLEEVNRLKTKKTETHSTKANAGTTKPFFRAKVHAADLKPQIGYHPSLATFPFKKRDDVVTTKGQTPAEKGARPCRHCGSGRHWDNECPHAKQAKAVHVHFSTAEADLLQALDEYEDARHAEQVSEEEVIANESSELESGNEESSD
jgi:hypothetical protein